MKKLFLFIAIPFIFGFTDPPYIPVTKPTPGTVITVGPSGRDYTTLNAVDTALVSDGYPSGAITPPVQIQIEEGTYIGTVTWSVSGTENNEIVITTLTGNTAPVIIEHANDNASSTLLITGSYVIIDGGVKLNDGNYGIIVDGLCDGCVPGTVPDTGSHYMVRLSNVNSSHITLSRIHMRDASGSSTAINFVPIGPDYVKVYNCFSENASMYLQDGDYVEIRNCISRNSGHAGIQVNPHQDTDCMDELTISGNIILNSGQSENYAGINFSSAENYCLDTIYIYNNIVYGCPQAGIQAYGNLNDNMEAYVYNNTCAYNTSDGIQINHTCAQGVQYYKNNLVWGNSQNWDDSGSHTCYDIVVGTQCENNLAVDPSFLSIDPDSDDFLKIGPTSAAYGTGADLTADSNCPITTDFEGDARTAPIDIGADEYVAENSNITITSGTGNAKMTIVAPGTGNATITFR